MLKTPPRIILKIINLIHRSGIGSELYKIITGELNSQSTLVLDEAESIRADRNLIKIL